MLLYLFSHVNSKYFKALAKVEVDLLGISYIIFHFEQNYEYMIVQYNYWTNHFLSIWTNL